MTTRKIALFSILLSIGLVLHLLPSFSFIGMKMDFLLAMMFLSILFCESYIEVISVAVVFGIVSALTTSVPGGQIPNIIDKFVTAPVFYIFSKSIKNKNNNIIFSFITFISTVISGSIFIMALRFIMNIEIDFTMLFLGIVLPTALGNTFIVQLLYYSLNKTNFTKLRSSYK